MTNPNLYRKAALLIFDKEYKYCCGALVQHKEIDLFGSYFKPENVVWFSAWFGQPTFKENQDHRVMALLLMEQIAKDMK